MRLPSQITNQRLAIDNSSTNALYSRNSKTCTGVFFKPGKLGWKEYLQNAGVMGTSTANDLEGQRVFTYKK
jgi:hypothetical protein